MFVGATLVNLGNYFFHLITGRMLGPADYGVLESVISSLYILGIIPQSVSLILVKYISIANGKGQQDAVSSFYYWSRSRLFLFGICVTIVLLLLIPYWVGFLKLQNNLFLIVSILSFSIALLLVHLRSYFNGKLDFLSYNINTIIEVVLKIVFSVILMAMGLSILGVLLGMVGASIISYLISVSFVRLENAKKIVKFVKTRELIKDYIPTLAVIFSMTSLFSNDILLVKHFFTSHETGIYAAVSVLGKIVFFASSSLIAVMFPLVVNKFAKGEKYHHTLFLTFMLVFLSSSSICLIYYFFPETILGLLFGHKYTEGKEILFIFGVFITIYALCNVLANFFLSIGKNRVAILTLIASIGQAIMIYYYHQSLRVVIYDSLISSFTLLVSLLLYYRYETRHQ